MNTEQILNHLKPQDPSHCYRFIPVLIRNLHSANEVFHSLVLGLLSIESSFLHHHHFTFLLGYLITARPAALFSTNLKIIAYIIYSFYSSNFLRRHITLLLDIVKFLVAGLVQIFLYLLDLFSDQDRLGVVEDAREALRLVLSVLDQMLSGEHLVQEPALAWSCNMHLLQHLLEMIEMEAGENRTPAFAALCEEQGPDLFVRVRLDPSRTSMQSEPWVHSSQVAVESPTAINRKRK